MPENITPRGTEHLLSPKGKGKSAPEENVADPLKDVVPQGPQENSTHVVYSTIRNGSFGTPLGCGSALKMFTLRNQEKVYLNVSDPYPNSKYGARDAAVLEELRQHSWVRKGYLRIEEIKQPEKKD